MRRGRATDANAASIRRRTMAAGARVRRDHSRPKDANFWRPSTRAVRLPIGTPFSCKLKAPHNAGVGFFAGLSVLPDGLAWETFREANGVASLDELRARLAGIHRGGRPPKCIARPRGRTSSARRATPRTSSRPKSPPWASSTRALDRLRVEEPRRSRARARPPRRPRACLARTDAARPFRSRPRRHGACGTPGRGPASPPWKSPGVTPIERPSASRRFRRDSAPFHPYQRGRLQFLVVTEEDPRCHPCLVAFPRACRSGLRPGEGNRHA
jgi:hypothetical protein